MSQPRSARRAGVCSLALSILLVSLFAGTAGGAPGDLFVTQVANIKPGAGDSVPTHLTDVSGTLFFQADDGTNGAELWKSNGAGATMVADINPTAGVGSSPTELTNVNGTLFFRANDGTNGAELWKFDGTTATMIEDAVPLGGINPGAASSSPTELTNVNGTLFFGANDGTNGGELWKSDGTTATMIEDAVPTGGINPGGAGSDPEQLADVNGTLFFAANDGTNGQELWMSTATVATMVADINPAGDSQPSDLADINGIVLFRAEDGTNGFEPWRSNGGTLASGGTAMVENIASAGAGSSPKEFTDLNGTVFFEASDEGTIGGELFKSEAPFSSASLVANINPIATMSSEPAALTDLNGTLFFSAFEPTNGEELWKSNGGGLGAGTEMVADINPAPGVGSFPDPTSLTNVSGTLFLFADDGSTGAELWKSDGTSVTRVADINPGAGAGSFGDDRADVNGTLFFRANDGSTGLELWRTAIEGAAPPPLTPPPATAAAATGLRAAALKRCKKKFRKGPKRTKCIKKARTLPV